MVTCRHCRAAERTFGRRLAVRERRHYRRAGPDATAGAIVGEIERLAPRDATLLDVGGGVGVIAHELLARGFARALLVDAASAYLEAARAEAEARGTLERMRLVHGDVVDVAADLPDADAVTLDRVVCCYPEFRRLLAATAAKCRRAYALSYPRDRWHIRLVFAIQNAWRRLLRDAFRVFVHPPAEIERTLTAAGLTLVSRDRTAVWVVEVYVRE